MADENNAERKLVLTPVDQYEEDERLLTLTPVGGQSSASSAAAVDLPPEGVLPRPRTDMYDDLSTPGLLGRTFGEKYMDGLPYRGPTPDEMYQQALARYKAYEESPNVRREEGLFGTVGDLIWTDPETGEEFVVPVPENKVSNMLFGGGMDPSLGQMLGGSLRYNMPRAIAEGYGMLKDRAQAQSGFSNYTGTNEDSLTATREAQMMPQYAPGDSFVDEIVTDAGAPFLVGTGFGGLAVKTLGKLVANPSNWMKATAFFAAETPATTALMASDTEPFLVGDESMLKWFEGMGVDTSAPDYEQAYARKMNLLKDVAVTSLGGELAAKTLGLVVKTGGIIAGVPLIRRLFSDTAAETDLGKTLINYLTDLDPTAPNYREKVEELIAVLNDNKEVIEQFNFADDIDIDDINFVLDSPTAYQRALEAGDTRATTEISERLRQFSNAIGGSKERTKSSVAAAQPEDAVDRLAQQTEAALGDVSGSAGRASSDGASDADINAGAFNQRVAAAADEAMADPAAAREAAQVDLDALEAEIEALASSDLSFISKVEEVYKKAGVDTTGPLRDSRKQVVEDLITANRSMTEEKDKLFSLVKGGEINAEDMLDVLDEMVTNDDYWKGIDAATATRGFPQANRLLNNARFRTDIPETIMSGGKEVPAYKDKDGVLKVLDEEAIEAGQVQSTRDETAAERLERFEEFLNDQELDYGTLVGDVRIMVIQGIDNLRRSSANISESRSAGILEEFLEYIDNGAREFVRETDPDVAEAADDAMDYYKNQFAPFWRDGGPLQEIDRLNRNVGGLNQSPNLRSEVSGQVKTVFDTSTQLDNAANIVKLFGRDDFAGSQEQLLDYILGEVVSKLDVTRTPGQRAEYGAVVSGIKQQLTPYIDILAEGYPQVRQQLVDYTARLDSLVDDVPALESTLKETTERFEAAQEEVFNKTFNALFPDGPPSAGQATAEAMVDNPYAALQTLLKSSEGMPQIRSLLNTGDPVIINGVRSAYARTLRDYLKTSVTTLSGQQQLSAKATSDLVTTRPQLIENGKEIFGEQEEVVAVVERLLQLSDIAQGTRRAGSGNFAGSQTNILKEYGDYVDNMIMLLIGPLQRMGARARVVSRKASSLIDADFIPRTIDAAIANPDELTRLMRLAIGTAPDERVTIKGIPMPTLEERRAFYRWAAKSYLYSGDEETFLAEYEAALQENLIDAEDAQMQELGLR